MDWITEVLQYECKWMLGYSLNHSHWTAVWQCAFQTTLSLVMPKQHMQS